MLSIFTELPKLNCGTVSNEILGWEGVEIRQLLCFFKA
jgi:hypothetical protein